MAAEEIIRRSTSTSASPWTPIGPARAGHPRRGYEERAADLGGAVGARGESPQPQATLDEMQGATFSISNLGGIGGRRSRRW